MFQILIEIGDSKGCFMMAEEEADVETVSTEDTEDATSKAAEKQGRLL